MKKEMENENSENRGTERKEHRAVHHDVTGNKSQVPLVIGVVIVLAFVWFLLSSGSSPVQITSNQNGGQSPGSPLPLAPSQVTVSGQISATGAGTQGTSVVFTSGTGNSYAAAVNGGFYSVALPNPGTYTINVKWAGQYSWQVGTSTVTSSLNLNQGVGGSSSFTEDISLNTPNSTAEINGAVKAATPGTTAIGIIFNSTQGYKSPVSQVYSGSGTYSVVLPTQTDYGVYIEWQSPFQTGYCYAGSITNFNSNDNADWTC